MQACHQPAGADEQVCVAAYISLVVRLILNPSHGGGSITLIPEVPSYEAASLSAFHSLTFPNL